MVIRDSPDFRIGSARAVTGDGEISAYSSIFTLTNDAVVSGDTTITYIFSEETADVDPGAGFIRLSAADQISSLAMRVSLLDTQQRDWTTMLDSFDNATGDTKGFLRLSARGDVTRWLLFTMSSLTTPTGYRNLVIAFSAASGTAPFVDGEALLLHFDRTNDGLLSEETGPIFMGVEVGTLLPFALDMPTATSMLNQFTAVLQGVVPASGGGTTNFLRADGNWVPAGGVAVEDNGVSTVASADTLNYVDGTLINVTVTDAGGGQADVQFNLDDIAGHTVMARQSGVAGPVNQAAIGPDQVCGRDGTGVIQGIQVDTEHIVNNAVTNAIADDMVGNSIKVRAAATTGDPSDLVLGNQAVLTRGATGILFSRDWSNFAGTGLVFNSGSFDFSVDFSSVTYTGGNFIDVTGTVISLEEVNAHDVLCRQSGVAGPVNTANVGADQLLGRPGTGVLQGTQVLTDMIGADAVNGSKIADNSIGNEHMLNNSVNVNEIVDNAVADSKLIDMPGRSIKARVSGTTGDPGNLSLATHTFPARQTGDIVDKTFTSLAGNNLTYNTGTGALDAPNPGDTIPTGNNSTITRNSAGTLTASLMGTNSVIVRTTGSPAALSFGNNGVLRRIGSGNVGAGQLDTGNYLDNSVTSEKVDEGDVFIWTASHTFSSVINITGRFSMNSQQIISVTTTEALLTIAATTNVLVITGSAGSRSISTINMAGGQSRMILLINRSTSLLDVLDQGGAGTAINQFAISTTSLRLRPSTGTWLYYDEAIARIRVIAGAFDPALGST